LMRSLLISTRSFKTSTTSLDFSIKCVFGFINRMKKPYQRQMWKYGRMGVWECGV